MKYLSIFPLLLFFPLAVISQSISIGSTINHITPFSSEGRGYWKMGLNLDLKLPVESGYISAGFNTANVSNYYLGFESPLFRKLNLGMKLVWYDKGVYENNLPKMFGAGLYANQIIFLNQKQDLILSPNAQFIIGNLQIQYSVGLSLYYKIFGL